MPRFDDIQIGQEHVSRRIIHAEDIDDFARLSGDDNDLHMDPEFARTFGYVDRVAHGMLSAAFLSKVIGTEFPGRGVLWLSQSLRFAGPAHEGDELTIRLRVTQKSEGLRTLALDVNISKNNGEPVLTGEARVMTLEKQERIPLERSVAIVTGASRGIGAGIARALAARGVKVAVAYRSQAAAADEVKAAIERDGGTALCVAADVTTPEGAALLVRRTVEEFGGAHILVNNASPAIGMTQGLLETPWEELQGYLDAYVKAPYLLAREMMPHLTRQHYGRIINVLSSVLYGRPLAGMGAYTTAKSALATFARCLAAETAGQGITVNNVLPSAVMTDQWSGMPEARLRTMAARNPNRRLAEPGDVAAAVLMLAGPDSDFITGASIPVTGGEAF